VSSQQAIVFDLDDTLYPERQFVFSGYRAVADAFSRRLDASFDLMTRMGELFDTPDRSRVFNVIVGEAGVPPADADALVAEMIATYRSHRPQIQLHPDADTALTRLRGRFRLGLISDGPLEMQNNKIDALGLRSRFDEIILTDKWGSQYWKPHPRAFEEMARRLAVPPQCCLYVADNPAKDFVAPNALGWRTLWIKRPGSLYADRPAPNNGAPHATIDTLNALLPG
jgi:putative hydrolase of the HAD superfamily